MKNILLRLLYIPALVLSIFIAVITMVSGLSLIYGIIKWICIEGDLSDYVEEFSLFFTNLVEDKFKIINV